MVRVKPLGHLQRLFGREELLVDRSNLTVASLLQELGSNLPSPLNREGVLVAVNGVEVSALEGDETPLKEADEVALIPIVHGG